MLQEEFLVLPGYDTWGAADTFRPLAKRIMARVSYRMLQLTGLLTTAFAAVAATPYGPAAQKCEPYTKEYQALAEWPVAAHYVGLPLSSIRTRHLHRSAKVWLSSVLATCT